jgi:cytochrome P450
MKFVWATSLDQTRQMLSSWTKASEQSITGFNSVGKDTRTLSLNVLAATGFRRSFSFRSSSEIGTESDLASSYREALSVVLDNVILLLLIPYRYLQIPLLPKSLQRIGRAADEYKQHMERMLEEETKAFKQGRVGAESIMTSFVRALNSHELGKTQGLSKDEVFGDIFAINFAGHDTTANTLAFAMFLLATEPEMQEWVSEEVQKVAEGVEDWDYERMFPRLLRCRAVLVC